MSAAPADHSATVHRSRVEWVDTDAAGIHHNSAIGRFVEAAEAQLTRDRDLPGYFPVAPRVHFEADYEAPLFFGQEVTTKLWVERVGRTSVGFAFEVWGEAFGARPRVRAASGRYVTVHIDGDHHDGRAQSAPLPPEWIQALSGP